MTDIKRPQPEECDSELILDVHASWQILREEVDRRLRVAMDEGAPLDARRRAAAWLADVSQTASTLDDS